MRHDPGDGLSCRKEPRTVTDFAWKEDDDLTVEPIFEVPAVMMLHRLPDRR